MASSRFVLFIKYHDAKIKSFRSISKDLRFHYVIQLYVYLRDTKDSNFQESQLTTKLLLDVRKDLYATAKETHVTPAATPPASREPPPELCGYCSTRNHIGGKNKCALWKTYKLSAPQAKIAGAKAARAIATGTTVWKALKAAAESVQAATEHESEE